MPRNLLLAALLFVPFFAYGQDDSWRNRSAHDPYSRYGRADTFFDLTPFAGYRYGGTIYANQSSLFSQDVSVASHPNFGVSLGIPISRSGMKVELMVDRQNTHFTSGGNTLFSPSNNLGGFRVTYFQGGLLVPLFDSRSAHPYVVVGAGVANLKPDAAGVSSNNRFAASAGVGVKVPINRNAGLRFEGRGLFTSTSNNNSCRNCNYGNYNRDLYQGQANLGIYFKF